MTSLFKTIKQHHHAIFISLLSILFILFCLSISNQIFCHWVGIENSASPMLFLEYGFIVWQNQALLSKWLIALLIPYSVIGLLVALVIKDKQRFLFGKAHWGSFIEAKKAGLFAKDGLILGKKWGQYIRVGGYEHVFVFAPSGSGKSTSLVIPNLLTWDGSCIVQDVKLSLFALTSLVRQQHGHYCFLWNPGTRDGLTHCYNPLDWVSRDKLLRIDDLQKIAHIFIPDNPKQDPIWTTQPRNLFVALALYLMDTEIYQDKINMGEMLRLVKNTLSFSHWLHKVLQTDKDLDPLCYRNFYGFLQTEQRLQSNILQSFLSYFELFDNPLIDAATQRSDFDITQLRKQKTTIYVGVSPDNLGRLAPLLTVFYQQVLDQLLRSLPTQDEPNGVLFMLDEFSALKRMDILQKSIGLLREYQIRMMIIIQDIPQLYAIYGQDGARAFINNKIRIAFAQNDLDAAKLISGWIGEKTIQQRTQNHGDLRFNANHESVSYTSRSLLKPEEILQLSVKKAIILIEGNPPLLINKNFWFQDPNLKTRPAGQIDLPKIEAKHVPFAQLNVKKTSSQLSLSIEDDVEEELFD